MAITSWDNYVAADRRNVLLSKTTAITTVAVIPFAAHHMAGYPGGSVTISAAAVAVAAGGSSTGEVPVATTANMGALPIETVAGTPVYYLSRVFSGNTVAARHKLYDRLWHVSMLTSALGTGTITAPGSFASRLPGGDYSNTEIILEVTTAIAAASTVTVTYTNELGTTGRTTGSSGSLAAFTLGRHIYLPLQSGDNGVQSIQTIVIGGTAGVGRVNVIVARPIWYGRVAAANVGEVQGIDRTGMPIIYPTGCYQLEVTADGTSSGLPTLFAEVAAL